MFLNILLLLVGIIIIYAAGSLLVTGASFVAQYFGIRKMVVAMTVVAFGTSAPEFVVSLVSVLMDKKGISLGNIVGSNIANVGLALGIGAVLAPIAVSRRNVRVEYPAMVALSAVFFFFAATGGGIGRLEAALLVASLIAFTAYAVVLSRRDMRKVSDQELNENLDRTRLKRNFLFILVGIAGLPLGSKFLVDSSIVILEAFDVPEFIIGATMVAVGTSIPEIATTAIGALRGEKEIAVGNIIGSNIFTIGMVAGIVGLITPLPVEASALRRDFPIMMAFALLMVPLLFRQKGLGKAWGIAALTGYVAFVVYLFSL
jgi:cation:H+ antiporter